LSDAYFASPLAQGTPGKQCGLAATGDYQPSLRSPWLAAAVHESVNLLQNLNRHPNPYWYNFGIAGHADLPLGTLLTINQVADQKTKKTWILPIQPVATAPGCNLVTVETAVDDYPGSAAYDMEAAGFTGAVSQFAELEQIRIIKIVSDNQTNSHRRISGKMVSALIQAKIDIIEQLLSGPAE
ncbi:MAG: hypothetical protein JMN26_16325, partial [gamma proteobacterium endosymbiont of Lamellibrachia anaximandri]|nr:hypothetical protein [gamma proteobacterium endosymbiont of Lamellibrachia anaximandri]